MKNKNKCCVETKFSMLWKNCSKIYSRLHRKMEIAFILLSWFLLCTKQWSSIHKLIYANFVGGLWLFQYIWTKFKTIPYTTLVFMEPILRIWLILIYTLPSRWLNPWYFILSFTYASLMVDSAISTWWKYFGCNYLSVLQTQLFTANKGLWHIRGLN